MIYKILLERDKRDKDNNVSYFRIIGKTWSKKRLPRYIIKRLKLYNILTREIEKETVVVTLEQWDKERKVIRANINGIFRE